MASDLGFAQLALQGGFLGLMILLIYKVPGWLATINEARAKEQALIEGRREKEAARCAEERRELMEAWRAEQILVRQANETGAGRLERALESQTNSLSVKLETVRQAVVASCKHPGHPLQKGSSP